MRKTIRETWSNELKNYQIKVVFVVAREELSNRFNNFTNDLINAYNENEIYKDILMANFIDRWNHLIFKYWAIMDYHGYFCSHIEYLAWLDSDILILTNNFLRFMKSIDEIHRNDLQCYVHYNAIPDRNGTSPYYVSYKQWPKPFLPIYCSGIFIMTSNESAEKISRTMPEFGIDYAASFRIFDVITGLIAEVPHLFFSNLGQI
ncbi:unnamed protein product [Dracunculus medinensis]|uniref:Hexosyltransferase n=1 Tax=Dracunculus medinensis TaxID=318479 RepID=A0A158Q5T0_DRAME|nr:unnamed protein product [Dracunculus medinensis]